MISLFLKAFYPHFEMKTTNSDEKTLTLEMKPWNPFPIWLIGFSNEMKPATIMAI